MSNAHTPTTGTKALPYKINSFGIAIYPEVAEEAKKGPSIEKIIADSEVEEAAAKDED